MGNSPSHPHFGEVGNIAVGTVVRIKPKQHEWEHQEPGWDAEEMDRYAGKFGVVVGGRVASDDGTNKPAVVTVLFRDDVFDPAVVADRNAWFMYRDEWVEPAESTEHERAPLLDLLLKTCEANMKATVTLPAPFHPVGSIVCVRCSVPEAADEHEWSEPMNRTVGKFGVVVNTTKEGGIRVAIGQDVCFPYAFRPEWVFDEQPANPTIELLQLQNAVREMAEKKPAWRLEAMERKLKRIHAMLQDTARLAGSETATCVCECSGGGGGGGGAAPAN